MYANHKPTNGTAETNSHFQTVLAQISSCCKEEKNLMIGVYDVFKNNIIYCSDAFRNILGYETKDIIKGGWEFWYKKINPAEAGEIKNKIHFLKQEIQLGRKRNGMAFSYHIKHSCNKWLFVHHELSLHPFNTHFIALNYLYDISQKEQIEYFLGGKKQISSNSITNISISKREKEVLMLIAGGFSSKQIADELYISNHTAIAHRKNLIEKFNVKNTAQLIKEASKSIPL